jgi:PAS domain-containing protein
VTEQRNAERERDRTRAFLDTIVDNVPATLVVKSVQDRRYVLINRAGENFFGLSREEMIAKPRMKFSAKRRPTSSRNAMPSYWLRRPKSSSPIIRSRLRKKARG